MSDKFFLNDQKPRQTKTPLKYNICLKFQTMHLTLFHKPKLAQNRRNEAEEFANFVFEKEITSKNSPHADLYNFK